MHRRPTALRRALRILTMVALAGLAAAGAPPAQARGDLIESRESIYNNIFVYRDGPVFSLTFGHNRALYTESIYDSSDETGLPVAYTRYMTVGLAYTGGAGDVLEIGFGGGRTAWYLHKLMPRRTVTSVELDPVVVELAKKYFGVREEPNFAIVTEDGRRYLKSVDATWPIILLDAYRGPFVPFHLLTQEFYQDVKAHLAEGGVVVQNVEPSTMMFDAALKTIGTVFRNLDVYLAEGNAVVVAYDGPKRDQDDLARNALIVDGLLGPRYPLLDMVRERRLLKDMPDVRVLTDDFAPVDMLRSIERHNRKLSDILEGK